MCGGRVDDAVSSGRSCLAVNITPGGIDWSFGACDYYWNHLSGIRYALYGGRYDDRTYCGASYLGVSNATYARWDVGAYTCIVII